ncbi:MAG: hypothetical protein C5B49_02815 [Bdellovibrio sp.]|nr:MAG: hypothetical protein C5B49_02815 [Bdellovibrio sp.]
MSEKPTGAAVSYAEVKPIFEAKCVECHNPSFPERNWLDEKTATQAAKDPKKFKTRVGAAEGPLRMPPEGKPQLDPKQLQTVKDWYNGLLNAGQAGQQPPPPPMNLEQKKAAFFKACTACHGADGMAVYPDAPNLAGIGKDYFIARVTNWLDPQASGFMPDQLRRVIDDLKITGERNTATGELTGDLAEVVANAANTFSQFKVKSSDSYTQLTQEIGDNKGGFDRLYKRGKEIVRKDPEADPESCLACHLGKDSLAPMDMAAMIFGQKRFYLLARLEKFSSDETSGTTMPAMIKSRNLSADDLKAIAVYLAGTLPTQVYPIETTQTR